jgi:hypothetical protein
MSKNSNYRSTNRSKHYLKYHLCLSITSIVRKLKQESTYHIWRSQHRNYLHTQFWVEKLSGQMVILFVLLEKPIQTPLNNTF